MSKGKEATSLQRQHSAVDAIDQRRIVSGDLQGDIPLERISSGRNSPNHAEFSHPEHAFLQNETISFLTATDNEIKNATGDELVLYRSQCLELQKDLQRREELLENSIAGLGSPVAG